MIRASIPSPSWQGFAIGPVFIHAYALCILTGIVLAMLITAARLKRRGVEPGVVIDIGLWAVVLGIIGARLWHVFTHWDAFFGSGTFGDMMLRVVSINQGGIAIFGALVGGALGAWIACRIGGLRFWTVADALAPGLLVAQAAGRWGNWFNHELFGIPTTLPWGLQIEQSNPAFPVGLPAGTLFQPTFLYESIWNLIGAALLIYIGRRWRLQWGRLFGCYLIWYGFGRFWLEQFLRIDPLGVFLGLRYNAWGALLAVAIGVALVIVQRRRHPEPEPSGYLPGREPAPAAAETPDAEAESPADVDEDQPAAADAEPAAPATAEDVAPEPATDASATAGESSSDLTPPAAADPTSPRP